MRLTVKERNNVQNIALRQYAEKKIQKLERYFHNSPTAVLEESFERGMHIVEVSIDGDGIRLRSEERCNDLNAAVDTAIERMEKQVQRFKNRVKKGHHRPGPVKQTVADQVSDSLTGVVDDSPDEDSGENVELNITRRKSFPMKPMSPEEAARQMELLDHNFFLFQNEDTNGVNVLYRRRDGNYGLIEPEL